MAACLLICTRMPNMKRSICVLTASVAMLLMPSISRATVWTDPATLQIGTGANTPCATPGPSGCTGDPVLVGSTKIDIYQNSGGAGSLDNPVLLILGIPNDTTNLFGSNPIAVDQFINGGTKSVGTSAPATTGLYNLTSGSGGFFGSMGPGQEVYSFLSLQGPTDSSNSFKNWSGAAQNDAGITATSYGIYVFALSDGGNPLGANGLININFKNALPNGTMLVADGEFASGFKIFDTPFTEAGMTTGTGITSVPVPEPASLMLLGSGLLVVSAKIRRRRR